MRKKDAFQKTRLFSSEQVKVNHEMGDRLILMLLENDRKKRGKMLEETAELLKSGIIPI